MTPAARARRRRYRERCRRDVIVLPVPVKHCQLCDALIRAERLDASQTADRAAVSAAVGVVLDEWIAFWNKTGDA
jgi:hypothetical protein